MWYNLLLSWPVFVVCFWINVCYFQLYFMLLRFIANIEQASWAPDISKRAQTMLHPTYVLFLPQDLNILSQQLRYRHQPSPASTPTSAYTSLPAPSSSSSSTPSNLISLGISTLTRLLLISDFTLVSRLILLVPLIGRPSATAYMSIINAYYFFE